MTVHAEQGTRAARSSTRFSAAANRSHKRDALRPGIVHRLDKDTAAQSSSPRTISLTPTFRSFQARTMTETYLALVHGKLTGTKGRIELASLAIPSVV